MTTNQEMATAYAAQEEVIAALYGLDETDLAERLERCMLARRNRHYGDGWPWTCRSAACVWCRRPMIRGWWRGMRQWAADATASSLAIFPLAPSETLQYAARRLRRGLRDVRDRTARQRSSWRDVAFAGMAGADHTARVMIRHDGVNRDEVRDALRRRWAEVIVKSLAQEMPPHVMVAEDAAQLGRYRRGIEPLRVVVMPQRGLTSAISTIIEPIPVLV
jgi:hypothetical protein